MYVVNLIFFYIYYEQERKPAQRFPSLPVSKVHTNKSLYDKVCQWLATGWFPPPIKLTNDITEIMLRVALNTINQTTLTPINMIVRIMDSFLSFTFIFLIITDCVNLPYFDLWPSRLCKLTLFRPLIFKIVYTYPI